MPVSSMNDPRQFFTPASARPGSGGYFLRITEYSREIEDFIWEFHEKARVHGAVLDNGLANPDPNQIQYFRETLGSDFRMDQSFLEQSLTKWMPRRSPQQIRSTASAMLQVLQFLKSKGKTDSILANCYTKYMCWLYFKMERAVALLGDSEFPKLLYDGKLGQYELQLLSVLCQAGCDILLLERSNDQDYLRCDPNSELSQKWSFSRGTAFPADFNLKSLRKARMSMPAPSAPPQPANRYTPPQPAAPTNRYAPPQPAAPTTRPAQEGGQDLHIRVRVPQQPRSMTNPPPAQTSFSSPAPMGAIRYPIAVDRAMEPQTNAWLSEMTLQAVSTPLSNRPSTPTSFCNVFVRVVGAPDRLTYQSDLHKMYQQFSDSPRKLLVLENEIPAAKPEEITEIRRTNYRSAEDAVFDLSRNLTQGYAVDLQPMLVKAFGEVLMAYQAREQVNLSKLTTTAVYLLCWMRRYQKELFPGWKKGDQPCLIFYGGVKSDREALFLSFLARLPVDVLLLMPNLDDRCCVADERLYVLKCDESVPLKSFPKKSDRLNMATTAYMAERDLDRIIYSDTGVYRDHQFSHTSTITLQTSIDEVSILWDKDLKYRPNFSTNGDVVSIPVLCAKINGVPRGNVDTYWQSIKPLLTPNTILVSGLPQRTLFAPTTDFTGAVQYIRNGVLQRTALKQSRGYPFSLLRTEMQEYIFDKIQMMLDQKLIAGTFENGTEYTILTTIMSISKQLIRMIQQYDFTKQNPKILVVHTSENQATREDAIVFAFLNLIGFDIAFFVPTGYQCVEQWYTQPLIVQHQAGDYVYDLPIPDFNNIVVNRSIWRTIFQRGN